VYVLRGKRYRRAVDGEVRYVYLFDVGSDVAGEAARILREAAMVRLKGGWAEYFEFMSRQRYFPRESGVLAVEATEDGGNIWVWLFCIAKSLPDNYVETLEPDGSAEVHISFGKYTVIARLNNRTLVGLRVGCEWGAICFNDVYPSDYFLFEYDYCKRHGVERCSTLPYEEAEDALRLLNDYRGFTT